MILKALVLPPWLIIFRFCTYSSASSVHGRAFITRVVLSCVMTEDD
jgi:hypothetical protein